MSAVSEWILAARSAASPQAALRAWEQAFRAEPDSGEAVIGYSDALIQCGRPSEAIAALEQALAPDRNLPAAAYALLGEACCATAHYDRAVESFAHACRLEPDSAALSNNLCVACLAAGRPEEATQAGERACLLDPDYAEARFNLGVAYSERADWERAASHLRQAVALEPEAEAYRKALARVLVSLRRWEEAAAVMRQADDRSADGGADAKTTPLCIPVVRNDALTPQALFRWLPASILLRGDDPFLLWRYSGESPLEDPFFYQTEERLARDYPQYPLLRTDLSALEPFAASPDSLRPNGFIFHLGRCGSTVVSNALRAVEGTVSLSEPIPLIELLSEYAPERWPCALEEWEGLRKRLVAGCVAAYGQRRLGCERRYFVKFANWNVLSIALVRALWPEVPCVFMYRDPFEIIASNLIAPPDWLREREYPAEWFGMNAGEVARMSFEEYTARVLGRLCRAAADALDEKTALFHYDELRSDGLDALFRFFGIASDEVDRSRLRDILATHAKDVERVLPFLPDSERKHRFLTAHARAMATAHTVGPYAELERLRPRYGLKDEG